MQGVRTRFEDHKTLVHPECQVLFTEDQGQALLVLTAPPRSDAAGTLALLAVLGQQQFTS